MWVRVIFVVFKINGKDWVNKRKYKKYEKKKLEKSEYFSSGSRQRMRSCSSLIQRLQSRNLLPSILQTNKKSFCQQHYSNTRRQNILPLGHQHLCSTRLKEIVACLHETCRYSQELFFSINLKGRIRRMVNWFLVL